MYSRYGRDWEIDMPPPIRHTPSREAPPREDPPRPKQNGQPVKNGGLSSLLSRFKDMDKGDLLLLAVLAFLLIEGEDMEIVILIALVLFIM